MYVGAKCVGATWKLKALFCARFRDGGKKGAKILFRGLSRREGLSTKKIKRFEDKENE